MKKIVIINGTGTSGKDTFVNFISSYINVFNFSSIDVIKEIASLKNIKSLSKELIEKIGYNGEKTDKDRKFLSDLKILFKDYNDLPFLMTLEAVSSFLKSTKDLMFTHIRESEEIKRTVEAIKQLDLEVLTLLIKRVGLNNISSNDSDKNVDNYEYDEVIVNDTLEELNNKAFLFVNKISLKNK